MLCPDCSNLERFYVWPDGSWLVADHYDEVLYSYKGDDFYEKTCTWEEIEQNGQ